MADLKQDEGRAWLVLVAAFLGVGIITDGIGVGYNQFSFCKHVHINGKEHEHQLS